MESQSTLQSTTFGYNNPSNISHHDYRASPYYREKESVPVDTNPPTTTQQNSTQKREMEKRGETVGNQKKREARQMELIPGATANRFTKSAYWLVNRHRYFALRQILMVILMFILTILGGVLFYFSEKTYEKRMVADYLNTLNEDLTTRASNFTEMVEGSNPEQIKDFLRNAYKQLLQDENRYKKSAYWKADDPSHNYQWTYMSAVFFSTNLFMSVDYGTVPNVNGVGRLATVIFACITIPLAIVVTRDLGQWLLFLFTKLYEFIVLKIRKLRGQKSPSDEVIELPIVFSLFLFFGVWFLCAAFICGYDAAFGKGSIPFFGAFYLAYETVTTVGMGDMMPIYTYKDPLWKLFCFFVGTPIKVVNHCTYVAIEKSIFFILNSMEKKLNGAGKVAPEDTQLDVTMGEFIQDRNDVYGGDYGRVRLNQAQLQ